MQAWHAVLLMLLMQARSEYTMTIQYNTDGFVDLSLLNITEWHTSEIQVQVIGCDFGYYDLWPIFPPTPSQLKTKPFYCVECQCENFNHPRTEEFIATTSSA